jgi:hypothetical protein
MHNNHFQPITYFYIFEIQWFTIRLSLFAVSIVLEKQLRFIGNFFLINFANIFIEFSKREIVSNCYARQTNELQDIIYTKQIQFNKISTE